MLKTVDSTNWPMLALFWQKALESNQNRKQSDSFPSSIMHQHELPSIWRVTEVSIPNRVLADPTVFKTVLAAVQDNYPNSFSINFTDEIDNRQFGSACRIRTYGAFTPYGLATHYHRPLGQCAICLSGWTGRIRTCEGITPSD